MPSMFFPFLPEVLFVCAGIALLFLSLMVYGMFKGNRHKD